MKLSSGPHPLDGRARRWWLVWLALLACAAFVLPPAISDAATQETPDVGVVFSRDAVAPQSAAEIVAYWTPERMKSAKPMELPVAPAGDGEAVALDAGSVGEPGAAPGAAPGGKLLPAPNIEALEASASLTHSMDPNADYPPPYQRWTWFGRYTAYPMSTIGKMFFSQGGSNFVCSGATIHRDRVATAGHCVSNGSGVFSSNVLFCPSYNAGGVNPTRGCWPGLNLATYSAWHNSGDIDYDLGAIYTGTNGTVHNNSIGNVTGWLGRAWNWSGESNFSFGYPAANPFPGYHIIACVGPHWYNVNWNNPDPPHSKYIGCDATGGTSGGPWILGLGHRAAEYGDPFSDGDTDVEGTGFLNGTNSHRRNFGGGGGICGGLCTAELAAHQFWSDGPGGGFDTEDFWATVFP